jgi:hypothetical protein
MPIESLRCMNRCWFNVNRIYPSRFCSKKPFGEKPIILTNFRDNITLLYYFSRIKNP